MAIAFATPLLAGHARAAPDIIVRYIPLDQKAGATPIYLSLSADGRYAAYNWITTTSSNVAVHDLVDNTRVVANLMDTGEVPAKAQCGPPVISGDARYAVFGCNTQSMGTPISAGSQAYYVYDRINNKTEVVPTTTSNSTMNSYVPAISKDGRYLAYRSFNSASETTVFVRDMFNKTTLTTNAKFARVGLAPTFMSISGDGRYVSYTGLGVVNMTAQGASVYDVSTGVTDIVNVNPAGAPSALFVGRSMISEDGKIAVFHSNDVTLTSPQAPAGGGIYVRDRSTGKTEFISPGIVTGSNANHFVISGNGRYVAYLGHRSNVYDIYVYDRLTKVTRTIPGAYMGGRQALTPAFSADGRYLAFHSFIGPANLPSIGIADLGVEAGFSLSSAALSLTEGGNEGTYTLALTQAPTADVVVKINADQQLRLARSQLTFTPANWSVPQVVSVQAVADGVSEGRHTSTIVHIVSSNDVNFTVVRPANVTATITDGVAPTITLPGATWTRSDMPVSGTAAPGATVLLTAVNRNNSWMAAVSTVADAQGRWSYTLAGFIDGIFDLDAQADGLKSAVRTVTVTLAPTPQPQPTFTDVTGNIRTTAYGLILNRATGKYAGNFVLTNTGSISLKGPLHLRLDNLTAGATLFNATGSHDGAPYITVPGGLAPDESVTIPLLVTNPAKVTVSYDARIFSGNF